jgi:hypothetical protein
MSDVRVKFISEFRAREDEASVRIYPAGWSGVVSEDIADAAGKEGALEGVEPEKAQKGGRKAK